MKVSDWNTMEKKLYNEAKKFLMETYGFELNIPIKVNGRLKSVYGRFKHMGDYAKKSIVIEMSKMYIENNTWDTIYSTLKHECIHYVLYETGKPYKDGHPYFERELVRHGSHSSGTVPYRGKIVVYACMSCEKEIKRKKKLPHNGAGCLATCCNARIKYLGEKII